MHPDEAKAAIAQIPLEEIDVSQPELFQNDTIGLYFERLRNEAPVHYCQDSRFRPYWSVTRYDDIMAVDKDHATFSSERGGIQIVGTPERTYSNVVHGFTTMPVRIAA